MMADKRSGSSNYKPYDGVILSKRKIEVRSHSPTEHCVLSAGDEVNITQYKEMEELQISKSRDLPTVTRKNYTDGSEADLEWSFIVDQKETSEFLESPEQKENDEEIHFDPSKEGVQEDGRMSKGDYSSTASTVLSGSNDDGYSIIELNKLSRGCARGIHPDESRTTYSLQKDGVLLHTTHSDKPWVAMVPQKGDSYVQNCDLPPSQSTFSWKGSLSRCDRSFPRMEKPSSSSADKLLIEASIRRNDPPSSGKPYLQASPTAFGTSDSTPFFDHSLNNISQSLAIPSAFTQSSLNANSFIGIRNDEQKTSKEYAATSKRIYETLGEALCLSQTRAMKAEKVASEALYDREKIISILFREAWVSHTYKQWVKTLEFENMWLKMSSQSAANIWMKKKIFNPYYEQVINSSKNVKNGGSRQHIRESDQNSFLGMIGIAFALGLSFASAGLMIGWSMGCILLAY